MKRFLLALIAVVFLASPTMADDKIFMMSMGGPDWSKIGSLYANAIVVAESGGDYTDLSDAVDAASANDTILVYPGEYTDTITFAANDVTVIGVGKAQNVILQQANANVVNFNTRSNIQMRNMTIKVTACNSDVDTITGSTGSFVAKFCNLQMVVLDTYDYVNLDQPAIVNVTGAGTFRQRIGRFTYTHPGDSAATGIKAAFKGADNSTIQLDHVYQGTITTSDGALATAPVFDLLVTTTTEINNCTIDVTDSTAGGDEAIYVVGIGYVGGDAITHEYFNNTIHVTGGASSTGTFGIFAVASATSTIATSFNHIHCSGAAANYGYSIGANNTINSNFDDIMAASGNTGGGTINMVSSQANGDLTITNRAITVGSGTGITVNTTANVNAIVYKVTTTYGAYTDSDTTKGIVICTLPAKTKIVGVYADTTAAYTGGAVSATTLRVGITAEDAAEVIADHDVKTAVVTKGLADADMGTSMTRAAAIQGGYLPSWSSTTAIYATINTTTANTSALTAGSTTFYIETERY